MDCFDKKVCKDDCVSACDKLFFNRYRDENENNRFFVVEKYAVRNAKNVVRSTQA